MIDWRITVATIIMSVMIVATLEGWLSSAIRHRRLKGSKRSITATQAIADFEGGLGLLVRNKSMLPGEWWFLRNSEIRSNYDFITNLESSGYVVIFENEEERAAIAVYIGIAEEVLDPFD